MARILLTTFGSFGDVNPYLGLAVALRARGHHPVVATSAWYRDHVEREGIEFAPVRPDIDPGDRGLIARVMDPRRGSEFLIRDLLMSQLAESHADIASAARGADLMVTHLIPFTGAVVAEEMRIPWVSGVVAPMAFFSVHDMPVFPPAPWMKPIVDLPGVARAIKPLIRAQTRSWLAPVAALRQARGLPVGGHPLFEGMYSPSRVLALFSRVIGAPQADWPAKVVVTGAIMYNGGSDAPLASEVEAFLAAGAPPVVFTLGSSAIGAPGRFYEESVAAAEQAGVRAILMLGPHPENRPARRISDSVLCIEAAPHALLFPRAAAVVHQAGIGTLHQALHSGKPELIVPYANDQPDNAYRAEKLGVARVIRPARYRAKRVSRALAEILADETMRARAAAIAAIVQGEDGVGNACDEIEMVLHGEG